MSKLGNSTGSLDQTDRAILRELQKDAGLSQREVAARVGLSQNACWRRIKALQDSGVILGQGLRLDAEKIGMALTVFVLVRTRHHSGAWLKEFRRAVSAIPNVIDFYRIAGDYDYMLKVVAADMNDFDQVYQRMISRIDLDAVTSYITMEAITDQRDIPV